MKPFDNVEYARPRMSTFNHTYSKMFDCDYGQLIPVQADLCIPGSIWHMDVEALIRTAPFVAPLMHELWIYFHTFFVPHRILNEGDEVVTSWEEWITGGSDGTKGLLGNLTWNPANDGLYSLWDYMGMPLDVTPVGGHLPSDYLRRAYNRIYNEHYRDENLIAEVDETTSEVILKRCWEKDFFTAALPWQQRGNTPIVPMLGHVHALWPDVNAANASNMQTDSVGHAPFDAATKAALEANIIALQGSGVGITLSDFRLQLALQKYYEKTARCGYRYTEWLKAIYGVSPADARLDRPEYVGGTKFPLIVSEVLQTSKTEVGAPQGNLAGRGIAINNSHIGDYRVQEWGIMMTIMSIMPRAVYQQGIDRQWLYETNLEYPNPSFVGLSEQVIDRVELYATAVEAENAAQFGYIGRYDEHRCKKSMICGKLRSQAADTLEMWHLARHLHAAPSLNQTFIECDGTTADARRCWSVTDQPPFYCYINNRMIVTNPIPAIAVPSL